MTNEQEQPIDEPLPAPAPAAGRLDFVSLTLNRIRRIPGAQPRPRFEFPPENDVVADEDVQLTDERLKFTPPTARNAVSHPIHFGFMAAVGVGIALLAFFIITNVGPLLVWIGAALFIALGLDPIVRLLEARGVPRPAGVTAAVLLLVGLVAGFFSILIPTIVSQTAQLVQKLPGYTSDFLNSDFFRTIDGRFQIRDRVTEEVDKFFADSEAVGGVFGGVLSVGSVIANSLFGTLVILVLTLYFLASLPSMKKWAYRLAPRSRRKRVELLAEEITRGVGHYVMGQAVVALLNATFAFIFMTIAGVPFSVLLAFIVALLAFIPLVGGMIAGILVSIVALTVGWQQTALFAVMYFAYLQFEAYFVSPRIMQKAVAVPGAVAVIAVIAGGSLLGVLGALMAIPLAAACLLLIKEVFIARQDHA